MTETDDLFNDDTTYSVGSAENEIEKESEVNIMSDIKESKRAKDYGVCLEEAIAAFQYADLKYDTEDVRKVATTFFIDDGKNGRTSTINKERTSSKTTPKTDRKIDYLKIELDKEYPITVKKDLGTVEGKYGEQRKFGVVLGDTAYYLTSSGKLANVLKPGLEVTISKRREGKYTKYSAITTEGQELLTYGN